MVTDGTGLSAQQWPPLSQLQVVDHTSRLTSVESLNQPAGKQLDQPDKQWIFLPVYTSVTVLSRCKHPESWAGVNSCKDSLVSRELFNLNIYSDEGWWVIKGLVWQVAKLWCHCFVLIHLTMTFMESYWYLKCQWTWLFWWQNKLASLKATLVRKYDGITHLLTGESVQLQA